METRLAAAPIPAGVLALGGLRLVILEVVQRIDSARRVRILGIRFAIGDGAQVPFDLPPDVLGAGTSMQDLVIEGIGVDVLGLVVQAIEAADHLLGDDLLAVEVTGDSGAQAAQSADLQPGLDGISVAVQHLQMEVVQREPVHHAALVGVLILEPLPLPVEFRTELRMVVAPSVDGLACLPGGFRRLPVAGTRHEEVDGDALCVREVAQRSAVILCFHKTVPFLWYLFISSTAKSARGAWIPRDRRYGGHRAACAEGHRGWTRKAGEPWRCRPLVS